MHRRADHRCRRSSARRNRASASPGGIVQRTGEHPRLLGHRTGCGLVGGLAGARVVEQLADRPRDARVLDHLHHSNRQSVFLSTSAPLLIARARGNTRGPWAKANEADRPMHGSPRSLGRSLTPATRGVDLDESLTVRRPRIPRSVRPLRAFVSSWCRSGRVAAARHGRRRPYRVRMQGRWAAPRELGDRRTASRSSSSCRCRSSPSPCSGSAIATVWSISYTWFAVGYLAGAVLLFVRPIQTVVLTRVLGARPPDPRRAGASRHRLAIGAAGGTIATSPLRARRAARRRAECVRLRWPPRRRHHPGRRDAAPRRTRRGARPRAEPPPGVPHRRTHRRAVAQHPGAAAGPDRLLPPERRRGPRRRARRATPWRSLRSAGW